MSKPKGAVEVPGTGLSGSLRELAATSPLSLGSPVAGSFTSLSGSLKEIAKGSLSKVAKARNGHSKGGLVGKQAGKDEKKSAVQKKEAVRQVSKKKQRAAASQVQGNAIPVVPWTVEAVNKTVAAQREEKKKVVESELRKAEAFAARKIRCFGMVRRTEFALQHLLRDKSSEMVENECYAVMDLEELFEVMKELYTIGEKLQETGPRPAAAMFDSVLKHVRTNESLLLVWIPASNKVCALLRSPAYLSISLLSCFALERAKSPFTPRVQWMNILGQPLDPEKLPPPLFPRSYGLDLYG